MSFVKPDDHAEFSPSSADRWLNGCSYSMQASEGIPNEDNKYSLEGTLAHSVCEATFRTEEFGIGMPFDLNMQMLELKDNGDEMAQAAHDFYEVTKFWLKNKDIIGDVIWYSQEGAIPVFPESSCYGTADFMIVGTKAAVVVDFKYGRKPVAASADQLKVYASGIARHIDGLPVDPVTKLLDYKIFTVIHQPRVGNPIKEHSYTIQELYACLVDIDKAITRAKRRDLEPVEGNHCFWCPAKRTKDINKRCKLIKEKPLKVAQENFAKFMADSNLFPDTVEKKVLRDEAIIKLMTLAPAIEDIVTQGREDFMTRIEAGELIPGITVNMKTGNRKYNSENDTDTVKMINDMFPSVNVLRTVTKTSVRPIGDIEKEVGKGMLDPICVRKVTKEVIVLDERSKSILDSMEQFAINISNKS